MPSDCEAPDDRSAPPPRPNTQEDPQPSLRAVVTWALTGAAAACAFAVGLTVGLRRRPRQ